MKHFYLILLVLSCFLCHAQEQYKHEKEARVSQSNFPIAAIQFIKNTVPKKAKKVKYYKETDSTKISYEVKFKYKRKKYSVEFNINGILEDVEVIIKQKHIPVKTLEIIKKHLYTDYTSFRIKKIQRQYRNTFTNNNPKTLQDAFSESEPVFFYEIIAEVKHGKKRSFIEITFDHQGNFQNSRTIIQSSYDHILY